MAQQPNKQTPYDQFNIEIPRKFPKEGISAAAANAIVNSETWTDANPMLNLSSFVTTYCEPEKVQNRPAVSTLLPRCALNP